MFDVLCEQVFTDSEVDEILNQCGEFLSVKETNEKFSLEKIRKGRYATVLDFDKLEQIITNKLYSKGILSLDKDEVNFIQYEKGHFFKEHTDILKNPEYRPFSNDVDKLSENGESRIYTLVIQLSDKDDYDGGQLFIEGVPYSKERGTVIIFKSSMKHSVSEITRGTRRVFTNFLRKKNIEFLSNTTKLI